MIRIRSIRGYENIRDFYFITTCGKVLSITNKGVTVLKTRINKRGYESVVLSEIEPYKRSNKLIHRIVASAFICNKHNKPQVNHINEVKTDNYIGNLEWVTGKENCNHGTRNNRISEKFKGSNNPMYGKKNEWLSEQNKKRTGSKNPKSKSKEYYSTKATRRVDFKKVCKTQGWNFEDFEEIFTTHVINKKGIKKDKKYVYILVKREVI